MIYFAPVTPTIIYSYAFIYSQFEKKQEFVVFLLAIYNF